MWTDTGKHRLFRLLYGRLGRSILFALVLLSLAVISSISRIALRYATASDAIESSITFLDSPAEEVETGRLHLLVPATSNNLDLCRLVLSAEILGYPHPVLINYGDREQQDPYVQHLAKVEGLLNYVKDLSSSAEELSNDMVLIVDGFDLWFQLRPDVLLKRYFDIIRSADKKALAQFGREAVHEHDIRHTVVFGPDKICWPIDFSRPACWAIPPTDLAADAFGPESLDGRSNNNDPRWLNSGTIIGPVDDIESLLRATMNLIQANHTVDSDQFYFAEIFGAQEYARLQHRPDLLAARKSARFGGEVLGTQDAATRIEPAIAPNERTEYHILTDGRSSMFQTLAFWKRYLTWMRAQDSWPLPLGDGGVKSNRAGRPYQLHLGDDVLQSPKPFSTTTKSNMAWADVSLNTNVVTGEAPVAIHFTGEKQFRDIWWQKLWFHQDAEELRRAAVASRTAKSISARPIGGRTWTNAESDEASMYRSKGLSGVETDKGAWLSWETLCSAYEADLYRPRHGSFDHAWSPI